MVFPYGERLPQLPAVEVLLCGVKRWRVERRYERADFLRDILIGLWPGLRITQSPGGKVSLWHYPSPPFSEQFHFANYLEFIANSETESRTHAITA